MEIKEDKSKLVAGFLIVGLLLIGFSIYFTFYTKEAASLESQLAKVELVTGKVIAFHNGYTSKEIIEKKGSLYNLDSVETQDTGEAEITFESTFKVRMLNNTLVTVEKIATDKGYQAVLILKRGEISVVNIGRDGELFIAKNGERISAIDYNNSQLAKSPISEEVSSPSEVSPSTQGLTEEEISSVMSNHRSSFFKCYTQLLQKDPAVKGDISLAYTIENNGKLSVAEISSYKMGIQPENDDFKKCLLEVLKRIEFRAFQGPPISTLFPLKFE